MTLTGDDGAPPRSPIPQAAEAASPLGPLRWSWKQAAKVATDEWHERLAVDMEAGRARSEIVRDALEAYLAP